MGMIARACSILGLSLALVGCSANFHTAYRLKTLPTGESAVITMDAKQRSILSTVARKPDGTLDPTAARNFCSEPSPDVFSVIAQSLSAGGSFGKSADPASIQIALNLAYSSAEQGSTIPRTQTINMLRELMFNTCLRYINGGIDKAQLAIQAIRDQRLMVSILAIEQLTGAVTPKPVVISASGNGGAGMTGEALVRLDDARKAKETAEAAYKTASASYDAATCDPLKGKKSDEDGLSDEQRKAVEPCNISRTKRDEALAAQTRTTATYQELSTLARSGGVTVATKVEASADGGLDRAHDGDVKEVAVIVDSIVKGNMSDDTEVMLYCLATLNADKPSVSIKSVCEKFVAAKVNRAAADQENAAAEQKNATARLMSERAVTLQAIKGKTENRLSGLWQAYMGAFATQSQRDLLVAALKSKLVKANQNKADCFRNVDGEASFAKCFGGLGNQEQLELLKLINK